MYRLIPIFLLIAVSGFAEAAQASDSAVSNRTVSNRKVSDNAVSESAVSDNATSNFDIGGSVRTRFELKENFRFDPAGGGVKVPGNDEDILLTQLRLHLDWNPNDRARFFFEVQDARIFGESEAIREDASPNIFADDPDLHQAYLDLSLRFGDQPAQLRIGRQKFNIGAKRLVSSLEWVNTARVWDGARLQIGQEKQRTLDLFASRVVAVDPGSLNDGARVGSRHWDSAFHGIYWTDWRLLPKTRLEVYALLRETDEPDDSVYTFGSRIERQLNHWSYHFELMIQAGHFGGLDHQATAAHAEVAFPITLPVGQGRLSLAYDFGSGDDDPLDDTHETFDNLYPLNHAYYGYMDFFSLQNVHTLALVWRQSIGSKSTLRAAIHGFWLDEISDAWYNAGGGVIRRASSEDIGSSVGQEFDLTFSRSFNLAGRKIAAEWGYGHFFTDGFVESTGPSKDADFFYMQMKVGF